MAVLLLPPLFLALLVRLLHRPGAAGRVLVGWGLVQLALVLRLVQAGGEAGRWFVADAPACFFLLILSLVFAVVALASQDFLQTDPHGARRRVNFVVLMLLFHAALMALLCSAHLALLWVFLEATTLLSASFIYFEDRRESVEAAWKYLFICSVGIALAYVGVLFLAAASRPDGSLFFVDLQRNAALLDPHFLALAFPFLLAGFATKTGLAPVHHWLPDAHAEAPTPVSALLSGALLNGAFLAILRLQTVMQAAGQGDLSGRLLLLIGLFSVLTAAACLRYVRNTKRLLAWSSVENLGLAAVGAGVGGAALGAALLHLLGHSLAKTAAFLSAGWVYQSSGSKEILLSTGLLRRSPAIGFVWLLSFAAIAGFPPFLLFSSKLLLLSALLDSGWFLTGAVLAAALVVAIRALAGHVVEMVGGAGESAPSPPPLKPAAPLATRGVLILLFLLLFLASFYRPGVLTELLRQTTLALCGVHHG